MITVLLSGSDCFIMPYTDSGCMENKCYICGRTLEECQVYIDSYIQDNMAELSGYHEIRSAVDKHNELIAHNADTQKMLSNSPEAVVSKAPQAFIDRYGNMTKAEYHTLCKYGNMRFSREEDQILGCAFGYCSRKDSASLHEIYEDCLAKVKKWEAELKTDLPDIAVLTMNEVDKHFRINKPMDEIPIGKEGMLKIPCCPVCSMILHEIASKEASYATRGLY